MMRRIIFLGAMMLILTFANITVFGQFDSLNKIKSKAKEITKKTGQEDASDAAKNSKISQRSAVNKGVAIVLTKQEYASFDEAKANAVDQVSDGDALWLYLKFAEPLSKYAYKSDIADDDGNIKYFLYAEIGDLGGDNSYADDTLIFKKEDLNTSELKIALAPGRAGRNKSLSMFLEAVGGGNSGVWKNEIRLSNSPVSPRSANDYLAKAPLTVNVSDGIARYRKMKNEYSQTVSRGTAEENRLPEPTRYANNALKNQILAKLKAEEGITPVKFFFTTDGWVEYTDNNVKQSRKIYAAYTYQKGAECLYGVAEVVQNYSYITASYGETIIYLRSDSPIQCSDLK